MQLVGDVRGLISLRSFGQQLRTSLLKEYYYYYLSYDQLKDSLKTPYETEPTSGNLHPNRRPWCEEDEKAFVAELEGELDKVFTFQRVKSGEIVRRIKASEREVNEVISRLENQGPRRGSRNGHFELPEGNIPSEDDFELLEQDLSDIIADVHDLAKFTQLNYTGFQKIIKKHDVSSEALFLSWRSDWTQKQTSWHLKPVFAARLKAKPFFSDNYDAFVVKLSKLYDLVRTKGNPTKGDSSAGGGQQNFVRQTTKYWVHPDNVTELKLIILKVSITSSPIVTFGLTEPKHLPVLVFNASKEFETKDSAVSSIYYDNPETFELYLGRLKKTEGAEAIRLRWYGGMESDTIFFERKTHREDWTGEKSVKARFSLKEKHVNAFLEGRMTVEAAFQKMRKDGKKSEKEISDLEQLAREIQYRVISRKLVPVTRSFYNRTAFQLPGDARVRISLDTELTMTREDNLDGRNRSGKNWRRMDIGIDWPFSQLPSEDIERFPYAVLEVKLQTQAGQEPPEWVRELIGSHLVEAVPKFSKFIHGTATLFPTRIKLLPFWMPQMDVDIRKPIIRRFGIDRPNQSASYSTSDDPLDDDDSDEEDAPAPGVDGHQGTNGTADSDPGIHRLREARDALEEQDVSRRISGAVRDENMDMEEQLAAGLVPHPDDYPIYDSEDENEEDYDEARKQGGWPYVRSLLKHHVVAMENGAATFVGWLLPTPQPTVATAATSEMKRFKAPSGKKVYVPVRVEPKVYFAAERTFLSWLEISIILGSIAATLLNFGDAISLASAWGFTIVACLSLFYSAGIYLYRVRMIRKRRDVRYHDWLGPSLLCALLVLAVAINIGLRFSGHGLGEGLTWTRASSMTYRLDEVLKISFVGRNVKTSKAYCCVQLATRGCQSVEGETVIAPLLHGTWPAYAGVWGKAPPGPSRHTYAPRSSPTIVILDFHTIIALSSVHSR